MPIQIKIIIYFLSSILLAACTFQRDTVKIDPPKAVPPYPLIQFYKKEGSIKPDCNFRLKPGSHKFRERGGCTNDDDYYFSISEASEGYEFRIMNNGDCHEKDGWAGYVLRDPLPGEGIPMTGVETSFNLVRNEMITRGLHAYGSLNKGNLSGKVSCVKVIYPPEP
ncbi:hypothetical protein [Pseudomonas shirazensis]|uniref:hypothetical protein n=1 Tax=Pseudomonas shirazensis TaxID=2745494 RepID=UPI003D2E8BA3